VEDVVDVVIYAIFSHMPEMMTNAKLEGRETLYIAVNNIMKQKP